MSPTAFNAFCAALPATTYVTQWGGAHVWKVGGKVFAIGWDEAEGPAYTFKTSEIAFEMLQGVAGCRPAPYMASRGLKWIQRFEATGLSDADLCAYLAESHRMVAAGLSKKRRRELGFI